MKHLRPLAFAAALVLAACTASPTDTPALEPAAPRFDGGITTLEGGNHPADGGGFGSGTFDAQDGGGSFGSGSNTAGSDTTGRGGNGMGSGN